MTQQPRVTAEDTCVYQLALQSSDLPAELAEVVSWVAQQSESYIWHQEAFNLRIEGSLLTGRTAVGDCIDDEWFIVWLLRQITLLKPETVATISDNDGQFLLIEAADALPKWVTPANADNRVLIHNGRLHLVPLDYSSPIAQASMTDEEVAEEQPLLNLEDAVRLVTDPNISTSAPDAVEAAVWARIAGYPDRITSQHRQRTLAYLPRDIARALAADPQLVASSVQAFYERDPVRLKACQFMSRFPPAASDARDTLVNMTRPLYAQLVSQRFYPPRPFEKAGWFEGIDQDSPRYRRRDIGMKLICGFEMLYQETIGSLKTTRLERIPDPAYAKFLSRLSDLGYFNGEAVGSQVYNKLEQLARSRYEGKPSDSSFATRVEAAIASGAESADTSFALEDSDSWLDLDPQELEDVLRNKGEQMNADDQENAAAEAEADHLAEFATRLEKFVDGEGSLEGALFDDDEMSEDEESAAEDTLSPEERDNRLAHLVPALPAEEWGRKAVDETPAPVQIPKGPPEERLSGLEKEAKFEGASDDEDDDEELDEEQNANVQLTFDEDADVDLASEMDDFLLFTREALGLSEDQYGDILASRRERGAFIPSNKSGKAKASTDLPPVPASMRPDAASLRSRAQAARNPNLNSFEALMNAMDDELRKQKSPPASAPAAATATPRSAADVPMREDAELDAELDKLLQRDDEGPPDYTLIKNFLESYQSQDGAGPVSNLAGRLGVEGLLTSRLRRPEGV